MRRMPAVLILFTLAALHGGASAEEAQDGIAADKKALAPVQHFVGAWKGGGGTRGDGAKESWGETAEWSFEFKNGHAALVMASADGKFFKSARLQPGEKAGTFKFIGVAPNGGQPEEYVGALDKSGDLVLDAATPAEGRPARLTFSLLARGKRLVTAYEKKSAGNRYAPLAEVGLTLKGSGFGKQEIMRECVITGGVGTMSVSYKGETYYFCCGGCKQAFEENPEKEIAAYKKRKEEEKKAAK